jgi:hypothetical protein
MTESEIEKVDLKNNFNVEIDTINHIIKVQPRVGKWDSTVLAIPINEIEFVHPEYHSQHKVTFDYGDIAFDALGQRFSGMICTGTPATKDLYYTFYYINHPTVFLFGSYPNRLYPLHFNRNTEK